MTRFAPVLYLALFACGGDEPTVSTEKAQTDTVFSSVPTGQTYGGTEAWTTPEVAADCFNVITIDEVGDPYDYYDDGADGIPERIRVDIYDPFPNLTRSQEHLDASYDSSVGAHQDHTYDASNRITKSWYDYDGFGGWDEVITYTWDGDGNLSEISRDWDDDGLADEVELFTYAPGTDRATERTLDSGADGVIEERETYGYDADNRLEVIELDAYDDGSIDSTASYIYGEAAPSMDYVAWVDDDSDPQGDWWYEAEYDANGLQTYYGISFDNTDSIDQEFHWSYDGDGQMVEQVNNEVWEYPGYGTFEYWVTLTFEWEDLDKLQSIEWVGDFGYGFMFTYREDSHWDCP